MSLNNFPHLGSMFGWPMGYPQICPCPIKLHTPPIRSGASTGRGSCKGLRHGLRHSSLQMGLCFCAEQTALQCMLSCCLDLCKLCVHLFSSFFFCVLFVFFAVLMHSRVPKTSTRKQKPHDFYSLCIGLSKPKQQKSKKQKTQPLTVPRVLFYVFFFNLWFCSFGFLVSFLRLAMGRADYPVDLVALKGVPAQDSSSI